MGSRVLSLWLPNLATDRIRSEQREAHEVARKVEGPLATIVRRDGVAKLSALCQLAERVGLKPGMSLHEAKAVAPRLRVVPSAPEADEAWLESVVTGCERYTPWVAIDRSYDLIQGASLWLDITNSAHRFGGEASLLADLVSRLRRQGITARAAIADHPGTAWAICRYGSEEQRILPTKGARVALASLPIEALRLGADQQLKLTTSGLDRVEHLYPLPRRVLSARFGDALVTRLDQALGLIDEPIAPHAPLPAQQAQLIFAEPVIDGDALILLGERLLQQLCIGLEAAGLGARRLILALYRVDNSTTTISIGTDRPCRDVNQLNERLADKMSGLDLGYGIERAILDAVAIEPLLPETIVWRGLGTSTTAPLRDCSMPADPLGEYRDRTFALVQRNVDHTPGAEYREVPARCSKATALQLEQPSLELAAVRETLPRPLRLLRCPEPIEAVAASPEEPPILFRWRQGLHKVVRAQGPERIAPDWWRIPEHEKLSPSRGDDQPARDYFAVESSEGERFWLFREGQYRRSSAGLPRWFLHGLFA